MNRSSNVVFKCGINYRIGIAILRTDRVGLICRMSAAEEEDLLGALLSDEDHSEDEQAAAEAEEEKSVSPVAVPAAVAVKTEEPPVQTSAPPSRAPPSPAPELPTVIGTITEIILLKSQASDHFMTCLDQTARTTNTLRE